MLVDFTGNIIGTWCLSMLKLVQGVVQILHCQKRNYRWELGLWGSVTGQAGPASSVKRLWGHILQKILRIEKRRQAYRLHYADPGSEV